MLDKINELSYSKKLDPEYLLSIFHSSNIEKNLKISLIVTQYESNIDFISVFSKAKVSKIYKTFKKFKKRLQNIISELTSSEKNPSHITHYLTVFSRIIMFKYIISQISSFSELVINSAKEYVTSIYEKEKDDDITEILSQFNMFLLQLKEKEKRPYSRMSTKNSTKHFFDDDITINSTPKFLGFGIGNQEKSLSFDVTNNIDNRVSLSQLLKKDESTVNSINLLDNNILNPTNLDKSIQINRKSSKSLNDKPLLCFEALKSINEMFHCKKITKEDRSFLKEKLLDKDTKLLSVFKEYSTKTKSILFNQITNYLVILAKANALFL